MNNTNNSQFWTWVDHWEGWDFMSEDLQERIELEVWSDETLWMICLLCGSPLEACDCEVQTPIPTPSEALEHTFQCDVFLRFRKIDSD